MKIKKKFIFLLLAVWYVMVFSGCGDVQGTADREETSESAVVLTQQESLAGDADDNDIDSADVEETEILEVEMETAETETKSREDNIMIITVNGTNLTAVMEENSSVSALMELLSDAPLTIEMSDYANMEKVGAIGTDLPRNDEQITTQAGDLILYQGNSFVIYYAPNSWNFTRLGKLQDITSEELKELLGNGDVTVTLSLPN